MSREPKEMVAWDIETEGHPKLRSWLGIDESIARLDGMSVEDMFRFADARELKMGNVKDPAKVKASITAKLEKIVEDAAVKQFGCRVTSIAAKPCRGVIRDLGRLRNDGLLPAELPDYEPPMVWTVNDDHDEPAIIRAFFDWLESSWGADPVVLCGFNIRGLRAGRVGFDVPITRIRAAVCGLDLPWWFPKDTPHDRRSTNLYDVCDVVSEGTCDQWLRMCGLPLKTASGADAKDMTPEELSVYNANDVEVERLLVGLFAQNSSYSDLLY